jgi:hypothetical protein
MRKVIFPLLGLILALGLALPMAIPASASPDSMTLNPNGAGAHTALGVSFVPDPILVPPALRNNWGVNTLDDGDTSFVHRSGAGWDYDLYTLEDPATSVGTITKVTVYIKAKKQLTDAATQAGARTVISDGTNVAYGSGVTLTDSYTPYYTEYVSKPTEFGGGDWDWTDISSLQAGVSLERSNSTGSPNRSQCTLVYVVVDYTISSDLTGQFYTITQGGWGAEAHGDNPGTYRDANFDAAFPSGLVIGDSGGHTATFTTAAAIEAFLPAGETAGTLVQNYTDPTTTSAGVLAGQVVALTLNVGFDLNDPDFSASATNLKDLVIVDTESPFKGWTVEEVLDEANDFLAGFGSSYTASQINECVDTINKNFENGTVDNGFLGLP